MRVAENLETIYHELAESVPASGWNMWVDMSGGEPFRVWLTPPGEQDRRNRHTLPLDFIINLDEFNSVEQRLTLDERVVVAEKFITQWFNNDIAGRIIDTIQDPDSYIHHAGEGEDTLTERLVEEMRIRQLDNPVLEKNDDATR